MKSLLPESDRILLGPGPSMTSPRAMRAMAAPTVGHLDPLMVAMLDDVRAKLTKLFRASEGSFAFAVSGTGTSGMEPIVFAPRALEKAAKCPSFYFDLNLLKDYWINRKYHHTMSSALLCALYEALTIVEEEGLDARWARHERNQKAFVEGLSKI